MDKQIRRRSPPDIPPALGQALPPLLQRVYAARGVTAPQQVTNELSSLLRPESMKQLPEAVALLAASLEQGHHILVVGDFDADGATSSALAVLALRAMGASVDFLVPNRFEYGYGLTPEIVAVARRQRPDLIMTVDNGISSLSGVAAAREAGIPVLVTDHHLPGAELPAAAAIVNPNQPDCHFASKHLAGVGVAFYLLSALRSHLRERGWFEKQGLPEPSMADYLDLVALGTVADVVPLDHNNRILVAQGLKRIRAGRCRPGITALLEVAGRRPGRIVSADMGFAVGPRLNAAGRLDDMSLGIQCLITDDPAEALDMARQLDDLNRDRRAIESGMQREALKHLQTLHLEEGALPYGLCLYNPQWHQGVIGILASRIKDRYHRPVIAFAAAEQAGLIKGSARSIPGLHIRDALDAVAARHPQLLQKFGGHAMAAGMSLELGHLEAFQQAFDEEVRRQLCEDDLQAVLLSDGELESSDFDIELARHLREAGPWGQHFPEPLFDGEFRLVQQRIVGEKHLKMLLAVDPRGEQVIDAIAFNVDTAQWPAPDADRVRVVYRLDVNEFRGRESLQLMVEYLEAL